MGGKDPEAGIQIDREKFGQVYITNFNGFFSPPAVGCGEERLTVFAIHHLLAIPSQNTHEMAPKKTRTAATAETATKARPVRAAAAASKEAAASAASTAPVSNKTHGKKRAAVDEVETIPAPTKKTAGVPKKKTKKGAEPAAEEEEEDAGDINEREIIASLSDVSADSSDDDQDDVEAEEANSSDEDDEDDRLARAQPRSSLASVKLPNSKDDAVVRARLDKLRKNKSSASNTKPGVLYIGRLPKGFFEKQLKSYFTQFGQVTRLRVSRNKKTGASKHYAFIEFADRDVAKIVQETMHNYLIDGRLLQVKEVSQDKVHPELWVGANRKFQKVPGDRIERVVRGREKSEEEQKRTHERLLKRQAQRREKLQQLGIEYEFDGYTHDGEADKKQSKKAMSAKAKPTATKSTKGKTAKA